MKNLQICLPHLSDVATLSWEIQKSFFNIILLQIIYVSSQKKQIATVLLQFYLFAYCCLVLLTICIALVLRLGHAAGGASRVVHGSILCDPIQPNPSADGPNPIQPTTSGKFGPNPIQLRNLTA